MTGTPEQLCSLLDNYYLGLATKADVDTFLSPTFSLSELLDVYYYFNNIPSEKYHVLLLSNLVQKSPNLNWWLLTPQVLFAFTQHFVKAEALTQLEEIIV